MNQPLIIQFIRIRPERDGDIPLPSYMTSGAAGMDIRVAVENETPLHPGEITLLPTGFAMQLPQGFEAQIRPRSGLAVKHGIGLINSPGTIDADYRGEVKIAVINFGKKPYIFRRGERVAQMVINRVYRVAAKLVDRLDGTDRSDGGFGHTGR
ncbi:MAG: deoxyuridine 5'-triphosphate nucleotidohydrolase [Deltaproteobacteria bacterium SG8_13]|nr:MAG: deoxyuridine 5'-triphosphate nucleotidohydrolase [Deltaproteobacteria bacterium SG8_13]